MKVRKALSLLKNLPQDWELLWGDSCNLLRPVAGCEYNEDENKTYVILFECNSSKSYASVMIVNEFSTTLSNLTQKALDSDLVFHNFQESDCINPLEWEILSETLSVKGFRRAKYTFYDFNICKYVTHHYVRMMLFNDDLDRKG